MDGTEKPSVASSVVIERPALRFGEKTRLSEDEDETNCGSYDLVGAEVEDMEVDDDCSTDEAPLPHTCGHHIVENEHHDEAIEIPSSDEEASSPTTKIFLQTRVDSGASSKTGVHCGPG
jgi:hypothetical protein